MTYNVLKKPDVFYIGKQDEGKAETIDIDYSAWIERYGDGVITATFQGAEDAAPYDIVLTTANGVATWTVTKANTAAAGAGKLQLNYIVNDVEAKSLIWTVRVYPSMRASGEAPDGYQDWLTALQGLSAETQQNAQNAAQSVSDAEDYADQAKASADSITGLTVEAETLPAGSSATASFDADTDKLSLGIPRGDKGEKGDTGQDGITPDLTIGTTETLPAGSSATATITGTKENPVLNLGIPQGIQGERGIKGDTGATPDISIGTVETLSPDESATATITGTAENPVLNLGIPKGDTGADGFSPSASVTKQDGNIVITVTDKDGTTSETLEVDNALDEDSVNPVQNAAIVEAMRSMLPVDTASGAIASFPDGADDVPMLSLKAQIEPVQEGSGDPSPDNVRPISGHTGVNVQKRGKNLYNFESASYNNDNLFLGGFQQDSAVVADGTFVLKAGTYTASANANMTAWYLYDETGNIGVKYNNTVYMFTLSEEKAVCFRCYKAGTPTKEDFAQYNIQLELGSTATDYEPYQGETITQEFFDAQGNTLTVYGGESEIVGGTLAVNRKKVILDGTQRIRIENWRPYDGTSAWVLWAFDADNPKQTGEADVLSNELPTKTYNELYGGAVGISTVMNNDYSFAVRVPVAGLDTEAKIVAYMAEHPIEAVYLLAEPIEYTLTGQEVRTFLGQNNIWSDTGNTEVMYRADIAKYIEKKVSA